MKIEWARTWMPVLNMVRDQLIEERSVRGRRIALIGPIEPKAANLAAMLKEAGAEVTVASQGVMVDDDVAAELAATGVEVFARHGSTREQELGHLGEVLKRRPEVVIDHRADVIRLAHTTHPEVLEDLIGASEKTASGVLVLRAMEASGALKVPCVAANEARCMYLFDSRYGSGQSTLAAVMDSTNLLIAGKKLVVIGYGRVGKGVARRARGLNAEVIVCEVDPFAALEAFHDGFDVLRVADACAVADIVITATGTRGALPPEAIERLRDGALLANAGGIDDEFSLPALRERAIETRRVREHAEEFLLEEGRSVFVVGEGAAVDLSAGEGHPVEIMDMAFAVQALSARYLLLHGRELEPGVHLLPREIDEGIAFRKLEALGLQIDRLTDAPQ